MRQFRVSVLVTQDQQKTSVYIDAVLFSQGRAEATLIVTGIGAPLATDVTAGLAQAILGRLHVA